MPSKKSVRQSKYIYIIYIYKYNKIFFVTTEYSKILRHEEPEEIDEDKYCTAYMDIESIIAL